MSKAGPDPMLLKYLDSKFEGMAQDIHELKALAAIGVEARNDLNTFKAQLKALWFVVSAIPIIGAAFAYIGWLAPVDQSISPSPNDRLM